MPQDNPLRPVYQLSLSSSLWARFEQTKDEADQRRSREYIRDIWSCRNAEPPLCIVAAQKIASNHPDGLGHREEKADILEEAVQLLPALCARFLSDAEKQSKLTEFFGLVNEAAAAFLDAGKSPSDALRS